MSTKVVTYDDLAQAVGLYDETIEGAAIAVENVLEFNTITDTTAQVTSGATVTSISITAVDFPIVTKGKEITLYHPGTTEFPSKTQVFVASQDCIAGDTAILVESEVAAHTFPIGSFILILGSQQQKYLAYTEKAIELGVKTWNNLVDENGDLLVDGNGDPIYGTTGNTDSQINYLVSQISILQDEIELRVTAGDVYAAINLGVLVNDLGDLESFATMVADVIDLNGLVTVTNFNESELLKKWVFRQADEPTQRPNSMPLQAGDLWWDSDGGNMPYLWNGTAWELAATQIDGASITTGYINAARIEAGTIDATKLISQEISAFFAEIGNMTVTDTLLMAEGGIIEGTNFEIDDNDIILNVPSATAPEYAFTTGIILNKDGVLIGNIGGAAQPSDTQIGVTGRSGVRVTLRSGQSTPINLNPGWGIDVIDDEIYISPEVDGKLSFFGVAAVTQATALTAHDASAVNSGDGTTDTVIGNMRTRINELETKLQAYGLLA